MYRNLRLQDPDTLVSILALWDAGAAGIPGGWLPRKDMVALGIAERFFSLTPPYRRLRLTPLGERVVEVLVRPKEK